MAAISRFSAAGASSPPGPAAPPAAERAVDDDAVAAEAARTRAMLGDIVVKPRFSSALSRELVR
ncbi:MAG: hypothetical protein ACLGI8_06305 [Acidimicrobiia bacterium]